MRALEYAVLTILALAGAYWVATTAVGAVTDSMNRSAAMIEQASS